MSQYLYENAEWDFAVIERIYSACSEIALNELSLDCYPNQIEIIGSERMLDAYSSVGMPIMYQHWSFGKRFMQEHDSYRKGHQGLAFEIVINSNPCINYLMEGNTACTQTLVIAHAAFGHNHFFKNNYLFKQWTDASSIVDYLQFAKEYIAEQEIKHGHNEVERWIDSCHALQDYGVDRYKRPAKLSMLKEKARQKERQDYLQSQVNEFYNIMPARKTPKDIGEDNWPAQPEENLLYWCEKYSPEIKPWQREILRIVRKIAQYFYPQGQTKVMNEGFASLTHYTIMNRLHEKGFISDGSKLEFLDLHTNVLYQPPFDSKYYNGLNPYKLGFEILQDIQRMCTNPTAEDIEYFPNIIGLDPWETVLDCVANYRDESFIRQWLSPKVIRDFGLFKIKDAKQAPDYVVTHIHNEDGYREIRESLADQYLPYNHVPQIEVIKVDRKTRALHLRYTSVNQRSLANIQKMIPHIKKLWGGYAVTLEDSNGFILS